MLQWVHGPRTVVSPVYWITRNGEIMLQWVHGPRTVVSPKGVVESWPRDIASMGPRSEDRGVNLSIPSICPAPGSFNGSTVRGPWCPKKPRHQNSPPWLQWVHGPRT